MELKIPEFTKGFKGYTTTEVDSYIEYVMEQFSILEKEKEELEKKVQNLKYKLEDAKTGEGTAAETIAAARQAADEIVKDANEKANAITVAVKDSFDEIVSQYREIIELTQNNLLQAQKSAIEFKTGIMDGYKKHVQQLNELIPLDSVDQVTVKSVDEVTQSAVNEAAGKLGLKESSSEQE